MWFVGCKRVILALILAVPLLGGCASIRISNPMIVENAPFELVWDETVNVLQERFDIERERPEEGAIESEYKEALPPLWAPWISDAFSREFFFEDSLHEVRRKVFVWMKRLKPDTTQLRIAVRRERRNYESPPSVYNEQYNLYDEGLTTLRPRGAGYGRQEWTYMGPDIPLEQYFLRRILRRLDAQPY